MAESLRLSIYYGEKKLKCFGAQRSLLTRYLLNHSFHLDSLLLLFLLELRFIRLIKVTFYMGQSQSIITNEPAVNYGQKLSKLQSWFFIFKLVAIQFYKPSPRHLSSNNFSSRKYLGKGLDIKNKMLNVNPSACFGYLKKNPNGTEIVRWEIHRELSLST